MALEKGRVCVTGAGGYLASWVVKLLLSKDYFVRGTVREPSDEKNTHLYKLEKASENLKLFKADLLDYDSVKSAIVGCNGVFHVASPVPSSSVELIEPAVKGTLNVLKACLEAKVKRVIVVSSGAAVGLNPRWPKGQIMDETCWSDKEYCRTTNSNVNSSSLVLIKRLKGNKLSSVVRVSACDDKENFLAACLVAVGTGVFQFLYAYLNSNKQSLLSVYTEGYESLENRLRMIVDVRDVAEALLLAYEKAEAEGRYICTAHLIRERDLFDKLKSLYPNYNYPKNFTEGREDVTMSSEKLQRLGWSFRPLEETLIDSIESYKKAGILD
ncbi:Epimerase domain-containing protein [Citrus sinensis]|nr:Epimerase domain-containing protein [Citrus sinensis]